MSLTIGQVLQGRYSIVKELGQGGMGAVYLAEDLRLTGRKCAIKEQIPDATANPQALQQLRQQFQLEAQTLAALDHPNLPKVSDCFSHAGNEYLVMEYIEGKNLESILKQQRGPLPEQAVLQWADQALLALAYLHGQWPHPIIHRDIKPANIILTPQGQVKLVDFGLVKLLDPQKPGTVSVMKGMGTPEYTPLEQYATTQGNTDARSDIYALSATLYHLLTNVDPPDAHQRFLDPSTLLLPRQQNPALSSMSEMVILKGMAMQPDQRYQSAQEFRAALAGYQTMPIQPPPPQQPPPPTRAVVPQPPPQPAHKKMPGWLWGVLGAALMLLVLLVFFITSQEPSTTTAVAIPTPISPSLSTPTATVEVAGVLTTITGSSVSASVTPRASNTPSLSPTVTTVRCKSDLELVGDVTIPDGTTVEAGSSFVKTWRVRNTGTCAWNSSQSIYFFEGDALGPPSAPVPAIEAGEVADISMEMVAPTKPAQYRGMWELRDAEGESFGYLTVLINVPGTPTEIPTATKIPTPVCISDVLWLADVTIPDGTTVEAGSPFIKTWRVRNTGTCAWDSSQSFLFSQGDQLGQRSAPLPAAAPGQEANISLEMVAPTKPGSYRGTWALLDVDGDAFGHLTVLISVPGTPAAPAAVPTTPPSTSLNVRLAFVSDRDGNKEIYLMNLDGSGLTRLTNNSSEDNKPIWSPDGRRIAFESYRDDNPEIYVMNADGSQQNRLTNDPANDEWPTWSPNGWLLFQSNTSRKWDIHEMKADGSGVTNLTDTSLHEIQPSWSPNSRQLVFLSRESADDYWDIYVMNSDGSGRLRLTSNPFDDIHPAWSPDGTRIVFAASPERGGKFEIYLINADGSGLRNLTNHSASDTRPAWSPDGAYLTFTSDRDGNREIYLMNADGSGLRNLTNHSASEQWAAWLP